MYLLRTCSIVLLSAMLAGCVSLSRYNDRGKHIQFLESEIHSLEQTLKQSEADRTAITADLRTTRENLAHLQAEHEALVVRSVASATYADDLSAIDAEKRQFAQELAALIAKLAEADTRIKELSTLLAAKEAAVRRIPTLEAAVVEREHQIKDLTTSLQSLEQYISQIKADATHLSRMRSGNEEKERTVAAVRSLLRKEANDAIAVKEYRDKVIITMKDQVLFQSGSARLTKKGRNTLGRIAKVLSKIKDNQILVEGHTDTVPVKKSAVKYRTNWDLAAARAANVLKFLEKAHVRSELLALAGYGCYLPAAPNDCAKNRQLNRRVEIAVVPLETERLAAVQMTTARAQ